VFGVVVGEVVGDTVGEVGADVVGVHVWPVIVGVMVVGEVVGASPQISKPAPLTEPSLVQVMVEPADTCTPSGPVVPLYCTPFTVSLSNPASVLNAVTDNITASCVVMVHSWLLA
jgi:hypothetical protein